MELRLHLIKHKKSDTLKAIATQIDDITRQENKLYLTQTSIHRRLMILKRRKAQLVTKFISLEQLKK